MSTVIDARDCTDVASLDPLNERTLVATIRKRYEEAKLQPLGKATQHGFIYTRAGPVIVAVNPLCLGAALRCCPRASSWRCGARRPNGQHARLSMRSRAGEGSTPPPCISLTSPSTPLSLRDIRSTSYTN